MTHITLTLIKDGNERPNIFEKTYIKRVVPLSKSIGDISCVVFTPDTLEGYRVKESFEEISKLLEQTK